MADEEPAPPPEPAVQRSAIPRWTKWFAGLGAIVVAVGIAGTVIHLPYDTFSPGDALNLKPRVSVHGAKTYSDSGQVMLLFVRERDHVNVWSWLQAKLDSNIEMVDQTVVSGGDTQEHLNEQGVCDMTQSKISARAAALSALGDKVKVLPGVDIVGFPQGATAKGVAIRFPAEKVLLPCDEIAAVDGHEVTPTTDISTLISRHRPGTNVVLRIIRSGHPLTVKVPVAAYKGKRIIGIQPAARYQFPVRIAVDTSNITGPSAGLAMTLAIIDELTPGDLTGGKRVAVTGTITPGGAVGQIGAIEQKGITAKAAHAQIFIVPACGKDAVCSADLQKLRRRVGNNIAVEPVSTLAQALRVLRDAGGAPVRPIIRPTS
jgi:PDZ domain-containing protein